MRSSDELWCARYSRQPGSARDGSISFRIAAATAGADSTLAVHLAVTTNVMLHLRPLWVAAGQARSGKRVQPAAAPEPESLAGPSLRLEGPHRVAGRARRPGGRRSAGQLRR